MKKVYALLLLFFFSIQISLAGNNELKIVADIENIGEKPISNKLFGLFIEFLQDYINGPSGMYPQEFLDRGFDVQYSNLTNIGIVWKDTASSGNPKPKLISGGYNENGLFFKRVETVSNGFAATYQQITYCDTSTHTFYLYYRGKVESGAAKIIAMDENSSKRLFEIDLPEPTDTWQKYSFKFPILADNAKLNIYFALEGEGYVDFDEVSMKSDNIIHGIRPEWYHLLKQLNSGLVRYPGGCFADFPNTLFTNNIGDIDKRFSPHVTVSSEFQRMDFGTDEFLQLCEVMNWEPHITLNFENGTPEIALNWIRYMNADTNDYWGKIRKANGRAAPYNVKLFEVGNEQWRNPIEYARGYLDFYDAIKKYDSSLIVMIDGNNWPGDAYFDTLYTIVGEKMDIYGYHPALVIDRSIINPIEDITEFVLGGSSWVSLIENIQKSIDERGLRHNVKNAITEWWSHWSRWNDWTLDTSSYHSTNLLGLANGGIGISFLKTSDFLEFAARTIGINFIKRGNNKHTGKRAIYGQPSYLAFQMLANHSGNYLVNTTLIGKKYHWYPKPWQKGLGGFENVLLTDAVVTRTDDSLFIAVFNRHKTEEAEIIPMLNHIFTKGKLYRLTERELLDMNTPEDPHYIKIETSDIVFSDTIIVPPKTLSIYAFPFYPDSNCIPPKPSLKNITYPNPANNKFVISLQNQFCEPKLLYLVNSNGVKQSNVNFIMNGDSLEFDISSIAKGAYYGIIDCGNNSIQFSFVKQ